MSTLTTPVRYSPPRETYLNARYAVSSWLLTITRNAAVDAVRYRHESPMDPDLLLATLEPSEGLEHDTVSGLALRQALGDLPPEQRRPILLMTFYGVTAKEIAEQQDIPLGTVKTRVRRGLRRLRDGLGVRDG